ncbi:unnamed protein product, partial [Prorocentrum cordatum]
LDLYGLQMTMKKSHSRKAVRCCETWLGGWTTSARLREGSIHQCLFGCSCAASGEWKHRDNCYQLWSTADDVFGRKPPPQRLESLGLGAETPDDLAPNMVASEKYRAMKHAH